MDWRNLERTGRSQGEDWEESGRDLGGVRDWEESGEDWEKEGLGLVPALKKLSSQWFTHCGCLSDELCYLRSPEAFAVLGESHHYDYRNVFVLHNS